jgi:predicted nucleic acid-binding protein
MLVLDTSVVLNLLASGRSRFLLKNMPSQVIVPAAVIREVTREPPLASELGGALEPLLAAGLLTKVEPSDEQVEIALELAGAPAPDNLDDGEAYAIALAANLNATIGVDERKARRIILKRWPTLPRHFTIELFRIAAQRGAMEEADYADLVFSALRFARMRIPNEYRSEIIKLIGIERARVCPSLGVFR